MKRMIVSVIAACVAPMAGVCEESDDDLKRFDRFATYDFNTAECDESDKGKFQYSCKNIETGDVSGYLNPDKFKKSATGRFLEKYWGTGDRLKFIGIACGRGETKEDAQRTAKFRAHEIVRRAVEGLETNVLIGDFQPLGYRKDEERYRCVSTARTANGKNANDVNIGSSDLLGTNEIAEDDDARVESERQAREAEEERRREAQEQQRLAAERERQATTLVVDVKSLDKFAVELSFFSDTYRNRAWPGGSQIYLLDDSRVHTYRLNCRKGEKICFGAWRRGNPDSWWWGSGYAGRQHCNDCCTMCGGHFSRTLLAGSNSPASASNGNAANALADILGGVAAGVGAANAFRTPSTPTYRAPTYRTPSTPQGATRRQSTITGTP
jgi:hypothetical protein